MPFAGDYTGCLLHGFGASAQDLVGVAPSLGCAQRWIFPHAPVPISVAGMSYGRAWFPRESSSLEAALFGTYFQSLRTLEPDGLNHAAWEVRALIASLGIDWSRLVLGGFSQGAMVCAEILRQAAADHALPVPAAVLLFSGALVAESWWDGVHFAATPAPVVFGAHGTSDAILPIAEGRALRATIEAGGIPVTWYEFDGRHEIPDAAITRARELLPRG